ncbi:MHYT domain-containing protein [Marinobacter sp. ANT_B65]|uniref:MHYT domain-containing protein n=1 Tax=Marinobacter sp. ANT_B65 TaxID=2039467 RepID=UPI000BBEE81F|nr:MHYT domain-containing protein [Marinobacter sp. ANT_B65]PCM44224.1 diguanylate cyclase [Marinobacter sp. ANT_B65]
MIAAYDLPLVMSSFLVAVLAAYAALYFGARLVSATGVERWRWLASGAFLMGTGIWTMHFVGMRAMPMKMAMSFDIPMTLVSWFAAVSASGIALHIIGRKQLGSVLFVGATLSMASGIAIMHYLGMYAMQMSAPPVFNTGFLVLSIAIAIVASGSALALCRKLQEMEGSSALVVQFIAALVMAAAICGMHYTGMMAMTFPEGAVPAIDNGLRGSWMGIPLAIFCMALLSVALFVTALDVRYRRELAEHKVEDDKRVAELAFSDSATGLPNRSALEQRMLDIFALGDARKNPFALVYLEVANFRELSSGMDSESVNLLVSKISEPLRKQMPRDVLLARYSPNSFFALVPEHESARHTSMYQWIREHAGTTSMQVLWRTGQSVYPVTGNSTRKLIRAAMVPRDPGEIGRFTDITRETELTAAAPALNS